MMQEEKGVEGVVHRKRGEVTDHDGVSVSGRLHREWRWSQ